MSFQLSHLFTTDNARKKRVVSYNRYKDNVNWLKIKKWPLSETRPRAPKMLRNGKCWLFWNNNTWLLLIQLRNQRFRRFWKFFLRSPGVECEKSTILARGALRFTYPSQKSSGSSGSTAPLKYPPNGDLELQISLKGWVL